MARTTLSARLVSLMAAMVGRSGQKDLLRLEALYAQLDDGHLREELGRRLTDGSDPVASTHRARWLQRFRDSKELHALAIGVCLFDRHPCDLPEGSSLYDEQRQAALRLLDGLNVQMATGEGKTYAIALAATALLTRHPQVIVITTNAYLAGRDRQRVSSYFAAAGVACERGVPGPTYRGVSYATLGEVTFGYLWRAYRRRDSSLPDYPVRAAVIIDEIDSVLLDQTLDHKLTLTLASDESTWEGVRRLADRWDERHYSHNPVSDEIALTADAWEEIAALARETGKPASLLMNMVSGALWARDATEGGQYVVDGEKVRLINQVTGEAFDSDDVNQRALEYQLFGREPPIGVTTATVNGLTLLRRHPHVVGLSGTVRDDAVYYLQQLNTLTTEVPPRFPRYHGSVTTYVSISRERTLRYLAERIAEVSPRPVVIGAWSPAKAHAVAQSLLSRGVVDESRLGLITKFDSSASAGILDAAGEPGRVTVLSQGGSRGVDVRSPHRPLLVVLGRAVEPRLDRQFLGRVGRHGEPFDAEFVVDPDSPIWGPLFSVVKLADGFMRLNRTTARGLQRQQFEAWVSRSRRRQRETVLSAAFGEAEAAAAAEFARLRELRGPDDLTEYLADYAPAGGTGLGDTSLAEAAAAIRRRVESDAVVLGFEAAVRAAEEKCGAGTETRRSVSTVRGEPTEIAALTRWLTEETGRLDSDPGRAALFRRQVAMAAGQRLPVRTSPHVRDPLDVVHETRIAANALRIEQTGHRLDSLRLRSSYQTYYRRAAFTVRNARELSELSARQEIVRNLRQVDDPDSLDELYYGNDHDISRGTAPPVDQTVPAAPPAPSPLRVDEAQADVLVATFLDDMAARPGGLAIPHESARLLLLNVLQPVTSGAGMSAAVLRTQAQLILDSLAAKGVRGGALREHRRLIRQFTDHLHEQGALAERLRYENRLSAAVRRARHFVATIPRLGVVALLGYLVVLAAGALPVAGAVHRFEAVGVATRLFGFGGVFPNRPALVVFAALVVLRATARACGMADPGVLLMRAAPALALAVALVGYSRGLANAGWTLLLVLLLTVWAEALLLAHRYVDMFVGIDVTSIAGSVSVVAYLAGEAADGRIAGHLLVAVGLLAATAGPGIPISLGSREYLRGTFRQSDDRARTRIVIDPPALSALAGFVVATVVLGVAGYLPAGGFVVSQLLALSVIAAWRLAPERVKGSLARLKVGSPLGETELRRFLHAAVLRSLLVAAVVLAGTVAASAVAARPTTVSLWLDEWAGVLLFAGAGAVVGAFSVAGTPTRLTMPGDDDAGTWKRIKEQLRAWRQLRFAWVWKTVLAVLVLTRPVLWLAHAVKATEALRDLWHTLGGLLG
ncbi:MAG TPA: hypothetical protein VF053_13670 [Streptosporangiales bacterium]